MVRALSKVGGLWLNHGFPEAMDVRAETRIMVAHGEMKDKTGRVGNGSIREKRVWLIHTGRLGISGGTIHAGFKDGYSGVAPESRWW